jgi:hypothetical protein
MKRRSVVEEGLHEERKGIPLREQRKDSFEYGPGIFSGYFFQGIHIYPFKFIRGQKNLSETEGFQNGASRGYP